MTKEYNETLDSLSFVEIGLLSDHIKNMDDVLKPGFSSVTWSSQRIPAFIRNGNLAIEKFKSTANEVQKHSSSIEVIINHINKHTLIEKFDLKFEEKNIVSMPEFSEKFENVVKRRLTTVLEEYQLIRPLLVKVEMVVTETDRGSSSVLQEYYAYWEKRIYNSIISLILRSLFSFLLIIQRTDKEMPMCEVKSIINGNDIQLFPSKAEIFKHLNRCTRTITDSAKAFPRWMKGTCIDNGLQYKLDDNLVDNDNYTYYDDVSTNGAIIKCLLQIKREVHRSFVGISSQIKKWKQLGDKHDLWDVNSTNQTENITDVVYPSSFFEMKFLHFDELSTAVKETSSLSYVSGVEDLHCEKRFDIFLLNSSEVASLMSERAVTWKNDFGDILRTLASNELSEIESQIADLQSNLICDPVSMEDLKKVIEAITSILSINMNMELLCRQIKQRYDVLIGYGFDIPNDEKLRAFAISSHWQNLMINARTKDLRLYDIKAKFQSITQRSCKDFMKVCQLEKQKFLQEGPGTCVSSLNDGLKLMDIWESKVERLKEQRSSLINAEVLFGIDPTVFQDLSDIEMDICELQIIYSYHIDFQKIKFCHASSLWSLINPSTMYDDVEKLEMKCRKLKIGRNVYIYNAVQEEIVSLKDSLPLISSLKHQSIQERHWMKLSSLTNSSLHSAFCDMTLADIFSMELEKYPTEVDSIINEATQEKKIEVLINDIEKYWEFANLVSQNYTSSNREYIVLKSTDELMLQLEDHMLNLQAISSSKFISNFKDRVKLWEKQLNNISETLDIWFKVQRKWIYLESIFVGAADIRLQLPNEAKDFDSTSQILQDIMKETNEVPNVIKACCTENKYETFQKLFSTLEICQKSLSDYLNTKRNAFARFYFISDDELISIMGSSDPTNIQPHLLKLFENVKAFDFIRGNTQIVKIESSEGEEVDLMSAVKLNGPVEAWMNIVDCEIKNSLWYKTKETLYRYANVDRVDWINDVRNLGMATICSSQTWWTWQVEDAFNQVKQGQKEALRNLESTLTFQLQEMVKTIRKPIDKLARKKLNTLLIIDVHARDIVSAFVRDSVLNSEQFEWESQLRFYWDREEDDSIIKQCTGNFRYGFEYMGLNGRLVITPLTDRCYMTLTQALTFKLGGSPSGPAGTGKV